MQRVLQRNKSAMTQSEWINLIGFAKSYSEIGCGYSKKLVSLIDQCETFEKAVKNLDKFDSRYPLRVMLNWLYGKYYGCYANKAECTVSPRTRLKRIDHPLKKETIKFLSKKGIKYEIDTWSGEAYWYAG